MAGLQDWNLMAGYAFYLVATFTLNMGLSAQSYYTTTRIALKSPGRWPRVLKLVTNHWSELVDWPNLLASLITIVLLGVHLWALRYLYFGARVTVEDVANDATLVFAALFFGIVMLILDILEIFQYRARSHPERVEKALDRTEWWLKSWARTVVRPIARRKLRRMLNEANPQMRAWLWNRSFQFTMQIGLGISLWLAWSWYVRPV